MKHICTLLLKALFMGVIGFPVYSQENPDRVVMENWSREVAQLATPQENPNRFVREEQDKVIIKLSENRLIIENLPKDEILEIYNIMGVKVYSRHVKAGTNEYTLSLSKGYYILKIGKITKKIAIR